MAVTYPPKELIWIYAQSMANARRSHVEDIAKQYAEGMGSIKGMAKARRRCGKALPQTIAKQNLPKPWHANVRWMRRVGSRPAAALRLPHHQHK